MIALKHTLRGTPPQAKDSMTDAECEELATLAKISNEKDERFNAFDVINLQFWVHLVLNSRNIKGEEHNDYTGLVKDGLGMFPTRWDHPMMHPNGMFAYGPKGMPTIEALKPDGSQKSAWMTGDVNRSTENPWLASMHFLYAQVHNKRVAEHGDREQAKAETLALIARSFERVRTKYAGDTRLLSSTSLNNNNLINTHEFAFGWGRFAHSQVPAKIKRRAIFDREHKDGIDIKILRDAIDTPANKMQFGISEPMQAMTHLPKEPHQILARTLGKAVTHPQNSWEAIARAFGTDSKHAPERCPLFVAILLEAEAFDHVLGPIGATLLSFAMRDSLDSDFNELLYHPLWSDAPATDAELIDWLKK